MLEHTEVTGLGSRDDRWSGSWSLPHGGASSTLPGAAVILATGGVGQLYAVTTNPKVATADGWALAHRVGALLRDIEFLQFHPTALKLPGVNPAPLISEAVRGAGAHPGRPLRASVRAGSRFPRASWRPETSWRGRWPRPTRPGAPGSTPGRSRTSPPGFPASRPCCGRFGLDPARDLLPVAPALHYAMGGIQTDLEGRTTQPGLWAVGRGRPHRRPWRQPAGVELACWKAWSLPTGRAAPWQRRCGPPPAAGAMPRAGRAGHRRRCRVRAHPPGHARADDRQRRRCSGARPRCSTPSGRSSGLPWTRRRWPGAPRISCWWPD